MAELKFFICKKCGKIIELLPGTHGCPTKCCGEIMEPLIANSVDAAQEKHVPVILKDGNSVTVQIGAVAHPMTEAHYIPFIVLHTNKEVRRHEFVPNDNPSYTFALSEGEEVIAAYAYCNLHGLWVARP